MIEIRNLTKLYGDFTAVDSISLTARPGEIFGFLGANGAGKTTTIRILAGLSFPTSGTALIGGHDVLTARTKAKAITGFVPDRPFLYEKLTGREMLRFIADLYAVDWDARGPAIDELLRYFDLARWADRRIESYSHGMKQKLVLIGALVHDPAVLIIDEPMVGLDALAQRKVKDLLRQQAAEQKTILLTTHTLSVAQAVCDRLVILHHGKLAAEGTVAELMAARDDADLEELFLEISADEAPEENLLA